MTQSEINIGLIGHVDHGKCIASDEAVLINNRLIPAQQLAEEAKAGRLISRDSDGVLYAMDGLKTYCLNEDMQIEKSNALVYVQKYRGRLNKIKTRTGRTIKLTRSHPLLVNSNGILEWKRSEDVGVGDCIAILRKMDYTGGIEINQNYLEKLGADYKAYTLQDINSLREKTNNFKEWKECSPEEFGIARDLLQISKKKFAKKCGISMEHYRTICRGEGRMGQLVRERVIRFLSSVNIPELAANEILLVPKGQQSQRSSKFRDLEINGDLIRFLAFLTAEGTISDRKFMLSQRNYTGMRDKIIRYLQDTGLSYRRYNDKDFHFNCKPFIDYLRAKFDLRVGNSRNSQIPGWILSISKDLKMEFLRWFFTFEADVNPISGQIILTQANKNNINIISYLLAEFGIITYLSKRRAKATNSNGPERTYYILSISGRDDLEIFQKRIGIEVLEKHKKIKIRRTDSSKPKNLGFPIDFHSLNGVLSSIIFAKRRNFQERKGLKSRKWYKGLEEARRKGKITHSMFQKIEDTIRKEIEHIRSGVENSEPGGIKRIIDLGGINYDEIARNLGISHTQVTRYINGKSGNEKLKKAFEVTKKLIQDKIEMAEITLTNLHQLYFGPIMFDEIVEKYGVGYNGELIDLTVPGHENFFAGYGGILCHNTSLTKSLSGIWTDKHSEEIKRGISIRLGYADCSFYRCPTCEEPDCYCTSEKCPKCETKTEFLRRVSFVDSPGHETLMATMLSGAAIMDGALLVITANEPCPQPQTAEHLMALNILGVKNIVVAQNKIDLVSKEAAKENYKQIKEFIKGTIAENSIIIPIAAHYNANIDILIQAIEEKIPTPERDSKREPRMRIARSFDINRPGVKADNIKGGIIGGSLIQGKLKLRDEIELSPGVKKKNIYKPIKTKIVSLSAGNSELREARPGGLIAIGTKLDPALTKSDNLSGNVLGKPGSLPQARDKLTMKVNLLRRLIGSREEINITPLQKGEALMLSAGSAVTVGIVTDAKKGKMDLKLPVCVEENNPIAISRRFGARWRLIGYGVIKE